MEGNNEVETTPKDPKEVEGKVGLKKKFSSPLFLTIFFIVVSVIMSFCACLVQTSGFQVRVTKGVVDMDAFYTETYKDALAKPTRLSQGKNKDGMLNAKLAYQLYMPKGVSAEKPAPAIALTHGYLNSKEFEEAPAIELSKQGFVVFAFDQYDHGDSTWNTEDAGGEFTFFMWSAYDAVEYLYAQDYVLKDSEGNGMVMVSGHSMGGFSTELAVQFDEINRLYGAKSYRMLAGSLAVGADFRYVGNAYTSFATRTCGTIAAEYDEFFFDNSDPNNSKTVTKKDYLNDPVGQAMLGISGLGISGENGKFYQIAPGSNSWVGEGNEYEDISATYGERVIYMVSGDHPYNTWSPEATQCMIDFYHHGFEHQLASHNLGDLASFGISKRGQSWWLKEVFTCIGLIAVFGAIISGISATHKIPVVGKLSFTRAESLTPVVKTTSKVRKALACVLTVVSLLATAWLIPAFMDRSSSLVDAGTTNIFAAKGLVVFVDFLIIAGFALALILGIIAIVNKARKKECDFKTLLRPAIGGLAVGGVAVLLRWVITYGTSHILGSSSGRWFNGPSINTIAFWGIASGIFGLIFALISHFFINEKRDISHLGLKASWKNVLSSFVTAVVISAVVCGFIWAINGIFKTDFRVYTYALKTVNGNAFVSSLRYLPFFFIFYLCAGISVASATAGKKGWKADLLAVAIEAGPSILFLLYQYIVLETTGVAPFPTFALNGILVQGLVIPLAAMAVFQRRTFEKTGNIWTGVFLNTIIFTFAAVANTTLYLL